MALIGIDLGTTNSLGVCWREGRAELIPNIYGEYLTPSVVSIGDKGEIIVGRRAKERLVTHPGVTIAGFKRFMGTDKTFCLGNKSFKPEELSAMVLKQLKEDAQQFLGEEVTEGIISVPAYFNDNGRMAVKNAGILAGLKVERLLNEPSAAALAYSGGVECEEERTYMVFDFGGGTLDISIVDQFENITEIIAVAGDNMLGGRDFDAAIAEYFYSETGLRKASLPESTRASILRTAEQCKLRLSEEETTTMQVDIKGRTYECSINQEMLVKISSSLFSRIKKVLKKALSDSGYTFGHIPFFEQGMGNANTVDTILMIGGSGKMPVIRQYLEHMTQQELCQEMNPDYGVALGIGVAVGIKQRNSEVRDLILCDICPFTLGIQVVGTEGRDLMSPIIERNTVLPSSKTEPYQSVQVNQPIVNIDILQGESRYADENIKLGCLSVKLPQNNKIEKFKVTFSYDLNGILNVQVKLESNNRLIEKVVINQSHKLSEEEIAQKVRELKSLTLADRKNEKYGELLARGNRLYQETSGELRDAIGEYISVFERALAAGDLIKIRKNFKRTDEFLKMAEVGQMVVLPGELEDMYEDEEWEDELL